MLNLRQIRADLATVAETAGFNAWNYQPEDAQDLPASVVGGIREFERLNRFKTRVQLGVSFYASLADAEAAAKTLDLVLSVGDPDSFIEILDSVKPIDGPAWDSIIFVSADPYFRIEMPGGEIALALDTTLEIVS